MKRMTQFYRKPETVEYVSYLKGEVEGLCRQVNVEGQPVTDIKEELRSLRHGLIELQVAMLSEEKEWQYYPPLCVRVDRLRMKVVKFFNPLKRKAA
jgi:hypothetical protein